MENSNLQLMISGLESSDTSIDITFSSQSFRQVSGVNDGYAILEIELDSNIQPDCYAVIINGVKYPYEIKKKNEWAPRADSISIDDSIYLVMPDRFARGKDFNKIPKHIRRDPNSRHGGNLAGITEHLDYIANLGITALWLTPILENDMPNEGQRCQYSFYHGYGITDFYNIDSHFGSLEDYVKLIDTAHNRNLKIIKDLVFNHCGSNHPWVEHPPMDNWISRNTDGSHRITNYKISTVFDPYAPNNEKIDTIDGWFTQNMPNLNLKNHHLLIYLTQMSIWWIESMGIDAIRMDTYPYVDIESMIEWQRRLQSEYPGFSVIAETWENEPSYTAKIQEKVYESLPECSFITMDFAFQKKLELMTKERNAFEIYNHFASDFVYMYPQRTLAFLDNHDLDRWCAMFPNSKTLKLALTILLTSPRIPQILYGTELMLQGDGRGNGDGNNRQDFPGGWSEDNIDKFVAKNRTRKENDMIRFLSKILRWRNENLDVVSGDMTHYIPNDNVLVYFRESSRNKIMVIINLSNKKEYLSIDRFDMELTSYRYGKDLLTEHTFSFEEDTPLSISSNSMLILNLQ